MLEERTRFGLEISTSTLILISYCHTILSISTGARDGTLLNQLLGLPCLEGSLNPCRLLKAWLWLARLGAASVKYRALQLSGSAIIIIAIVIKK